MSEPRAPDAPAPDALDLLLAGRRALSDRCERMAAALRESAQQWDDTADYFDGHGERVLALQCRRLARECREAAR